MVQLRPVERYTSLAARVREGMHFVSKIFIFYFWGSSEAAMGGGGVQRPVWHVNEPKKTGTRTRGQNPLVLININVENIACRRDPSITV
jgi:hypothetical protein